MKTKQKTKQKIKEKKRKEKKKRKKKKHMLCLSYGYQNRKSFLIFFFKDCIHLMCALGCSICVL